MLERWEDPAALVGDGILRVYSASDSEWLLPYRLAPFSAFIKHMTHYRQVVGDDHNPACVQLLDPVAAKPVYPLTDERCPTVCIIQALEDLGWVRTQGTIVHREPKATDKNAPMDGRAALKNKCISWRSCGCKVACRCVRTRCRPQSLWLSFGCS